MIVLIDREFIFKTYTNTLGPIQASGKVEGKVEEKWRKSGGKKWRKSEGKVKEKWFIYENFKNFFL